MTIKRRQKKTEKIYTMRSGVPSCQRDIRLKHVPCRGILIGYFLASQR